MRSWYGPDETREPWFFLTLTPEADGREPSLTGWAIGVGNPDRLLSTESQSLRSDCEEADLIVALGEILDTCRYTRMTLVTPGELTLSRLRRLTACSVLHSPTLRGFNHIALDAVLKRYFDIASVSEFNEQTKWPMLTRTEGAPTTDDNPSNAVERLWHTWTAIYRLVPATACLGEPL